MNYILDILCSDDEFVSKEVINKRMKLEKSTLSNKKSKPTYYYAPILTLPDSGVGIYEYWNKSVPRSPHNFFIYDGQKITYIKCDERELVRQFLIQHQFEEAAIAQVNTLLHTSAIKASRRASKKDAE